MDLGSLSNELVVALTPFLPGLLKFGESTATEMGKELKAEAGSWSRELRQRLVVHERPGAGARPYRSRHRRAVGGDWRRCRAQPHQHRDRHDR
jgi:hypothetical protein